MLRYDNFLLLESKQFEKKKAKVLAKIHNFCKLDKQINNDIIDKLIINDEVHGLSFAVWIADQFIKLMKSDMVALYSEPYQKWKNTNITINEMEEIFTMKLDEYLKTGNIKDQSIDDHTEFIFSSKTYTLTGLMDKLIRTSTRIDQDVIDWFVSPRRTEKIDISKLTYKEAKEKSKEWHDQMNASGVVVNEDGHIFMVFDDGYYWIDLETSYCEEEADAMGHCGTTNSETILSLRKNKKPHVTVAYSYSNGVASQIKGKGNTKPDKKYHKYIIELLKTSKNRTTKIIPSEDNHYYEIKKFGSEYSPEDDFKLKDLTDEERIDVFFSNKELFENFIDIYPFWKDNLVSNEDFVKSEPNLIIHKNKVYFYLDDWNELTNFKYEQNFINILGDNGSEMLFVDFMSEFDFYDYNDIDNSLFVVIKDYIIENELEINDVLITNENIVYDEKIKDLVIKVNNLSITLKSFIEKNDIDDLDYDESIFDEITNFFQLGASRAYETANYNEAYTDVLNSITKILGPYAEIHINDKWRICFDVEFIDLDTITSNDDDDDVEIDNNILDMINNSDVWDGFDVNEPQYGWQGHIKTEDLIEEIIISFI